MNTNIPSLIPTLVLGLAAGCVPEAPTDVEEQLESNLTSSERRNRSIQIRDQAATHGLNNGLLLAGITNAETNMAHCWSEATWACQGPASVDCGGGPVIAGSGDGPCWMLEGGLGMFQFDGGTHSQTLAREGQRILTINGSVDAAVDFVVNMVIRSDFVSGVSNRTQAIDWMNGVQVGGQRWDGWLRTVTAYYNGCYPGRCSVFSQRYAKYDNDTRSLYNEFGADFWGNPNPNPNPNPGAWASLSGAISADVAIGRNADGRLELFARGSDGSLVTTYQVTPNGGWSDWSSMGGGIQGRPAAVLNQDGRLQVFVKGVHNAAWSKVQTTPNGGFGGWISLGGGIEGDIAAELDGSGHIQIFARGTDGRIYRRVQSSPGGNFGPWGSVGNLAAGGLHDPAVTRQTNGRLAVFARGQNDGMVYASFQASHGGFGTFSLVAGPIQGAPTVGINQDGRLEVFGRGAGGDLVHAWQHSVGGAWSGTTSLGGGIRDPFVARNQDGRLVVVVRGNDQRVYRIEQTAPNSHWGDWTSMTQLITGRPSLGVNQDGRLEAFGRDANGSIMHTWQSSPSQW